MGEVSMYTDHKLGGYNSNNEARDHEVMLAAPIPDSTRTISTDRRILGNNFPVKDANRPNYSFFDLCITGHIQSGVMNETDGVTC